MAKAITTQSIDSLSQHVDDGVLISVRNNLRRIEEGSSEPITTPLLGDGSPDEILKEFRNQVFGEVDSIDGELMKIEEAQISKFGPRSLAKPWSERRASTRMYYDYDWKDREFHLDLGKSTLNPWDAHSAAASLPNATSSGLPYMRRKGDVKDLAVQDLQGLLMKELPSVLFTRTQEGRKTRDVWGYGIAQVLQESRYYRPLLRLAKTWPWRSALHGPDAVDIAVTTLMSYAKTRGMPLVSIDFSSFDHSVSPAMQKAVFDAFSRLFQRSYQDDIVEINRRFTNVGLVTPDGIWNGPHGVPSGSAFTNEVDSAAQLMCAREVLDEEALKFAQIQGDDGAYCAHDPDGMLQGLRQIGLSVNEDKSVISDTHMVYLQRYYSFTSWKNGVIGGIYPVSRALNRLCYMERWTDFERDGITGDDFFSIRTIAILENCKHHPWYVPFVKFVASRDRNFLSFTQEGLRAYVRASKMRGSHDIVNQYSDEVSGLQSFETVKLLKELAPSMKRKFAWVPEKGLKMKIVSGKPKLVTN